MNVREAIVQGSADLKFAGIKTPRLDAELLLTFVLKTNRSSLITLEKKKLSDSNCAKFCELIERRCNGECVAYLIENKEFRGLDFIVNKYVLVPRPDTETLVEAAIEQESINSVLDLCTGSGAVAISLKHEMPKIEMSASDICENALAVAKANAAKLLPKNSIQFYLSDLFNAIPNTKYSMIVSNPPYISSNELKTLSPEVQNEPSLALAGGVNGLDIIKSIVNKSPDYLQKGGVLLLEADPRQMDEISILLEKMGFNDIKLYKDLSDSNRVIRGVL